MTAKGKKAQFSHTGKGVREKVFGKNTVPKGKESAREVGGERSHFSRAIERGTLLKKRRKDHANGSKTFVLKHRRRVSRGDERGKTGKRKKKPEKRLLREGPSALLKGGSRARLF